MKTFHRALDEFLELKKNELKPYTKFGYSERIKRLKDIFADLKLEDITTEEVQDYVDDWQKIYSVATINGYLLIIKQVLKQNGITLEKINVKNDKSKKLRLYSAEDIEKIEQYYSNHKEKIKVHHLPIFIALYTGMRIGEILGLQWLDVDLDRGLIDVSKNAQEIKENGTRKRIIQTPKTLSSNRTIAIPQQLIEILRPFKPKDNEDWDIYVCSGNGQPHDGRSVSRSAEILFAKAGVNWQGFHAFRHSYATRMMEKNIPVKAISDLLGHNNIGTTMNIYSHTTNDFKKECVKKIFEDEKFKREKEKEILKNEVIKLQQQMNEIMIKIAEL